MRLKATREVYYASKTRNVGDEFNADEQDARILIGIGKAVKVDLPIVEPAKIVAEAAVKVVKVIDEDPKPVASSASEAPVVLDDEPKPKRRYMRRDMQAKE